MFNIPIDLKQEIGTRVLKELEKAIKEEINKVIYRAEDEIADRIKEISAAIAVKLLSNISMKFSEEKLIIEVSITKLDLPGDTK